MFQFDDKTEPEPIQATITVSDSESFTVTLSPLDVEDRITDAAFESALTCGDAGQHVLAFRSRIATRFQQVTGWDVTDPAGTPIPYTLDALLQVLGKYPACINSLSEALSNLYSVDPVQTPEVTA